MSDINTILFQLAHQGAGYWPLLDNFFIVLTSYIAYAVVALTLFYVLLVVPFKAINAKERLMRIIEGVKVTLTLFITWVVVWAIKVLVAYPRPFVTIPDIKPLVDAAPLESFPSAHAAFTMALAIAVLPHHKHLGHALIAFALVVSLSRLYVGVHYPFDIGVGLLIGFIIPKLLQRVFRK